MKNKLRRVACSNPKSLRKFHKIFNDSIIGLRGNKKLTAAETTKNRSLIIVDNVHVDNKPLISMVMITDKKNQQQRP